LQAKNSISDTTPNVAILPLALAQSASHYLGTLMLLPEQHM
jgi:hypothetical protein